MPEHKETIKGAIQVYQAPTYDALVKAVVDGRRKLGKPTNYNRVYNELKKLKDPKPVRKMGAPQGTGKSVHEMRPEDIANGIKAIFKTTVLGEIVSQEEILRRSQICSGLDATGKQVSSPCPKLENMKGCMTCGAGKVVAALYERSRAFFKGQRYEIPVALKKANCGVCKCYLSNMLPARLETFKENGPHQSEACPNACWIKNRT
jgi:hypothetical protein